VNPAGYSGRSLTEKLGIRAGMRVALVKPPEGYLLRDGVELGDLPAELLDFIHAFVTSHAELEAFFAVLKASLAPDGMLWVSWYKKSSRIPTDLDENIIRDMGLAQGLVDVKVAAVDERWSGLKFVYRLKDRH
jgi:hypothetical protein